MPAADRSAAAPPAARLAAAIGAAAGLALLAAACGGSSGSHVSLHGSIASARGSTRAGALRYARCMRAHGITDFPDPNASGDFAIRSPGPNGDLNRDDPRFRAAERACRRSSPQQAETPAQHAQLEREYLSFARCVRSHGVGDFPDPVTGTGGHPGFHLQGGSNSDVNASNPAFRRGVEACQHILGHRFEFRLSPGGVGKGA